MRTGFNIKADNSNASITLEEYHFHKRPPYALVMNDSPLARRLYDITNGETTVIYRQHSVADGRQWQATSEHYVSPRDYANQFSGLSRDFMVYVLNEPSAIDGSQTSIFALCRWLVDAAQHLLDMGFSVCLGNFGVGTYELEDVRRGYYDLLIQFVCENRDRVRFGLHEYAAMFIPFGIHNMPDVLDKNNWRFDIPFRDIENGYLHDVWHIGRCHWFVEQAKALGYEDRLPRIVLTEYGIDRLPDVQHVFDVLEKEYGKYSFHPHHADIEFSHLQGFYTFAAIYEQIFGLSYSEVIFKQLVWGEAFYPDFVEGMLLFMAGRENPADFGKEHAKWDLEGGFNIGADSDLLERMLSYDQNVPETPETPAEPPNIPIPEPEEDWVRARIWATGTINGRPADTFIRESFPKGKVLGSVPFGEQNDGGVMGKIKADTLDDTWVNLQIGAAHGFSHSDYIAWIPIRDVPEVPQDGDAPIVPIDPTPIPPSTIMVTRDLKLRLSKKLEWFSQDPDAPEDENMYFKAWGIYMQDVEVTDDEDDVAKP